VALLDRYGKLRDKVRKGKLHTGSKEILPFLKGTVRKEDLPAAVVEPGGIEELRALLQFAGEKHLKIAVASGLKPVEVSGLDGAFLLLTTRLARPPVFSSSRRSVRVDGGLPVESLMIDLNRAGLRWLPLHPVPSGTSPGELMALGWEGLRTWCDGGFLSQIRAVEWMGFDGTEFVTGPAAADANSPDVSGFLFGSRGSLGIITSLDLDVRAIPRERTAVLLQLPDAASASETLAQLGGFDPQPETVVYWGEAATQILREGNDNRVSERTVVMLAVEWREAVSLPADWAGLGHAFTDEVAVNALWQDLFRFPKTAARLYPERTGARMWMPADAVAEVEEAARELGRDFNLPVALWGTVESGQMRVWVMQPDVQTRTQTRAEELLKKLVEVAAEHGSLVAPGNVLPFELRAPGHPLQKGLREKLLQTCDPNGMYAALMKG
jgi:FAD/FMN-containing dehydrogenase